MAGWGLLCFALVLNRPGYSKFEVTLIAVAVLPAVFSAAWSCVFVHRRLENGVLVQRRHEILLNAVGGYAKLTGLAMILLALPDSFRRVVALAMLTGLLVEAACEFLYIILVEGKLGHPLLEYRAEADRAQA